MSQIDTPISVAEASRLIDWAKSFAERDYDEAIKVCYEQRDALVKSIPFLRVQVAQIKLWMDKAPTPEVRAIFSKQIEPTERELYESERLLRELGYELVPYEKINKAGDKITLYKSKRIRSGAGGFIPSVIDSLRDDRTDQRKGISFNSASEKGASLGRCLDVAHSHRSGWV